MEGKALVLAIRFSTRHPGVKFAITALIMSLLIALAAMAYWVPAYQGYAGLEEKISDQRNYIYTTEQNKKLAEFYARSKKSLHIMDKKLGSNKSQADHVKLLDKMLKKRRMKVVNETFETEKLTGGYVKLSQELSLQGDYGDLRRFLIDLDDLPTWTVVQELRIEKLHSYGSMIKAMLRMSTYSVESKQDTGDA